MTDAEREAVWRWLRQFKWPTAAVRSEKEVNDARLADLAMRYLDEGERE